MKKLISGYYKSLIIFILLIAPDISSAAGLVPDCGASCRWNDLMALVNNVITFILKDMVVPIAAIMFAYAGILMVSSAGSTESRGKAKKIFSSTASGLILALGAWLIISTILSILGYNGAWIGLRI